MFETSSKVKTIAHVYLDPAGFGSIKEHGNDARKHAASITEQDARKYQVEKFEDSPSSGESHL